MLDSQLQTVDVMDNIVFNTISDYYKILQRRGYHSYADVKKILVLSFYWNFVTSDYRGLIEKKDYSLIERTLNCLFGSTCLIPYPDYLKMGKLKLGEMTEVLARTKAVEAYSEELNLRILDNDVLIADNTRRLDEHNSRVTAIENTKVVKGKSHVQDIPDIVLPPSD